MSALDSVPAEFQVGPREIYPVNIDFTAYAQGDTLQSVDVVVTDTSNNTDVSTTALRTPVTIVGALVQLVMLPNALRAGAVYLIEATGTFSASKVLTVTSKMQVER
jgi:hypothetical protein